MPIRVICGSCHAAFRARDDAAGKRGRCPKCGASVEVPGPATHTAPALGAERTVPPPGPKARMQAILDAFSGEIVAVRTTLGYRLGVLLVTGIMLLLPILYLGLIASVAFLIYYH